MECGGVLALQYAAGFCATCFSGYQLRIMEWLDFVPEENCKRVSCAKCNTSYKWRSVDEVVAFLAERERNNQSEALKSVACSGCGHNAHQAAYFADKNTIKKRTCACGRVLVYTINNYEKAATDEDVCPDCARTHSESVSYQRYKYIMSGDIFTTDPTSWFAPTHNLGSSSVVSATTGSVVRSRNSSVFPVTEKSVLRELGRLTDYVTSALDDLDAAAKGEAKNAFTRGGRFYAGEWEGLRGRLLNFRSGVARLMSDASAIREIATKCNEREPSGIGMPKYPW